MRLLVLQVGGLFLLLGGWAGTAGSSRLSHQFAWAALGVVGFLVAASGTGAWLLTGRRAVGVRLQALLRESEVTRAGYLTGAAAPRRPGTGAVRAAARVVEGLVSVQGTDRYHRGACVLVRGKDVQPQDRALFVSAGLRACELCAPDAEAS